LTLRTSFSSFTYNEKLKRGKFAVAMQKDDVLAFKIARACENMGASGLKI